MGLDRALAVYHVAPGKVALRERALALVGDDQIVVKSCCSAISPGTESLIFRGKAPSNLPQDESIATLQGGFIYPFSYGYALAGEVIEVGAGIDRNWLGRKVLAFHPHQDYAIVPVRDCLIIPEGVSPRAAVFLPSMESALNFVMDARPVVGENVMVFGQGVVGLLTTAILSRFPLARLITADRLAFRRARSLDMGAGESLDTSDRCIFEALRKRLFDDGASAGLDLAVELSGNMHALNQAIELTGFAGRILIGSWYGADSQPLDLGGWFHRRRIALISSQVSTIAPELSGRWDKSRRFAQAWEWIRRIDPERLITHAFPAAECQQAFERVSEKTANVVQAVFEYP